MSTFELSVSVAYPDKLEVGALQDRYTQTGRHSGYQLMVTHTGLNEIKHLKSSDYDLLINKAEKAIEALDKKYRRFVEAEEKASMQEQALSQTQEQESQREEILNTLHHTLDIDDSIDWDSLKTFEEYKVPQPKEPVEKVYQGLRPPEQKPVERFVTPPTLLQKLFLQSGKVRERQLSEYESYKKNYEKLVADYEKAVADVNKSNSVARAQFDQEMKQWEKAKRTFEENKDSTNRKIDEFKERYLRNDPEAVAEHARMVLDNSEYCSGTLNLAT